MKKIEYKTPKTKVFEMKSMQPLLAGSEVAPGTGNPDEF